MAAEIAVVIVGMNTRDWVRGCLESLRAHDDVTLEIVVVDNCSEDGSCEMIEEAFPEATLIRNSAPYGFAQNNNIGAAQTSAPILLFLNPDTEVPPGALRAMLVVIERQPNCGIFGGKLADADRETERSVGAFPTLTSQLLIVFSARCLSCVPSWIAIPSDTICATTESARSHGRRAPICGYVETCLMH